MHYIRESHTPVIPPFMSDTAYTEARQSIPFVATDAVITDIAERVIYLAWRRATPARGWWVIGGGLKNGQSPQAAMAKNFGRETSLVLPEDRFCFLTNAVNFTQWTNQEQISNLHLPFSVELSASERSSIETALDTKEYEERRGLQAFTLEALLKAIEEGTGYPQPVLYYDVIFGSHAYAGALARWQEQQAIQHQTHM